MPDAVFGYDTAGRPTSATIFGHQLTYGFAGTGGCGPNTAAGMSGNRTALTDVWTKPGTGRGHTDRRGLLRLGPTGSSRPPSPAPSLEPRRSPTASRPRRSPTTPEGYTVSSKGNALISADGLRQARPPSFKPYLGYYQSDFESRWNPFGPLRSNGHLDMYQ